MYLVVYITPGHDFTYRIHKHCNVKLYDIRESSHWLVISVGIYYMNRFILLNDYHDILKEEYKKRYIRKRKRDKYEDKIKKYNLYILPIINTLILILICLFFFNR